MGRFQTENTDLLLNGLCISKMYLLLAVRYSHFKQLILTPWSLSLHSLEASSNSRNFNHYVAVLSCQQQVCASESSPLLEDLTVRKCHLHKFTSVLRNFLTFAASKYNTSKQHSACVLVWRTCSNILPFLTAIFDKYK